MFTRFKTWLRGIYFNIGEFQNKLEQVDKELAEEIERGDEPDCESGAPVKPTPPPGQSSIKLEKPKLEQNEID